MFENLKSEIDTIIDNVISVEIPAVFNNGKYSQYEIVNEANFSYQVHEYVSPFGVGFTIIFYASDGGKDYVKTVGYGTDGMERTYDWEEVIDDLI